MPAPASLEEINGIVWARALPAVAFSGVIAAVLMSVSFGLGVLATGALSVVLYRRRNPYARVTPGMGARLGAMSGIAGFVFFSVFAAIGIVLFRSGGRFREMLMEAVQQSASRNSDPQAAQQVVEFLKTPSGFAFMLVFMVVFMFLLFLILSSLGGALAAALQRRRERH